MSAHANPLHDLAQFPLLKAIHGRRSRRFGLGMTIPSGPLAFTSRHAPQPLSELEQAVLVAVGTGVTGWNFGVPFTPSRPGEHAHYTGRFTGRTAPTAAGIGTPVLFYTDDSGTYLTNTRDLQPGTPRETIADEAERLIAECRRQTTQLSSCRLDLPRVPPHTLEHNQWVANAPGSTLFMPLGDASEQLLGLLTTFVGSGYLVVDDQARRPAGNLAPFIRSGLLDESKAFPLSLLERITYEANCAELAFIAHNMVLTMQGMGLGGWFYTALNSLSVLGAFADHGVKGLGFRFAADDRWVVPNPVGLDGRYEGLCPPYYPDMRAAVRAYVDRKFGPGGAYDPNTPGPWKETPAVKGSVSRYSDEFVECLGEIAQHIYDTYGKFPGTIPTMVLTGFVQAQHIDTEYYDKYFGPGAYLDTHANHMRRWHGAS